MRNAHKAPSWAAPFGSANRIRRSSARQVGRGPRQSGPQLINLGGEGPSDKKAEGAGDISGNPYGPAKISAGRRARRLPYPSFTTNLSRSCSYPSRRRSRLNTSPCSGNSLEPPGTTPREGRTQMSPTLFVVDFVGGSRSSVTHAGMEPADRCDATRGNLQADRVDAAEATSPFCEWFCASSSSQSSSPRTSSSIWLSSPYCPPSHRDGDYGTVQSRIDVHCTPITTAQ
jgi:hypothetical protein